MLFFWISLRRWAIRSETLAERWGGVRSTGRKRGELVNLSEVCGLLVGANFALKRGQHIGTYSIGQKNHVLVFSFVCFADFSKVQLFEFRDIHLGLLVRTKPAIHEVTFVLFQPFLSSPLSMKSYISPN